MCWWNSVVKSTKRFNSVVFLQRLKASYSVHLSQHLSWFLFGSWYRICDEQMVLFSLVTFWLSFVETSLMFRVNIWSWHHIYFLMCFGEIIVEWKYWTPWVRSFGMIRIWDQNQRSQITRINHDQMNQWILVQNGFIGSFVPFGESKNGFLILDLPDFAVERNVKSEIGFVTLVTFRQSAQCARQTLKKWRVFYSLTNYAIIPCRI